VTELRLQSERVEWREVEGELIALERSESVYLAGNQSATILWRALAAGTTEAALADLLVSTFGIAIETARADVARFLHDLSARGLLEAA
jgi:coenzyme PQQ synthesis protein D (PqqD)